MSVSGLDNTHISSQRIRIMINCLTLNNQNIDDLFHSVTEKRDSPKIDMPIMFGKGWTDLGANWRFMDPSTLPTHIDWSLPLFQYSFCLSTSRAKAEGKSLFKSNTVSLALPSILHRSIFGRVPPSSQYKYLQRKTLKMLKRSLLYNRQYFLWNRSHVASSKFEIKARPTLAGLQILLMLYHEIRNYPKSFSRGSYIERMWNTCNLRLVVSDILQYVCRSKWYIYIFLSICECNFCVSKIFKQRRTTEKKL